LSVTSPLNIHPLKIVGVNKYRLKKEDPIETRQIDNTAVREAQINRINSIKAKRDQTKVTAALNALTESAKSGNGNKFPPPETFFFSTNSDSIFPPNFSVKFYMELFGEFSRKFLT
jgi:hypothetical protein